ncbi:hypothetical protein ACIQ6Y_34645 [Streptomyces sp. NPDC096205]|uniref:hypothetical protein n=1 Tax=Streptomyces sp. NPDC096205 TaxID=3366081 RepID=UPI0038097C3B
MRLRKPATMALTVGLAFLGLSLPTTTAQAATVCDNMYDYYNARGNHVHAWSEPNCGGTWLGDAAQGTADWNWGDSTGDFTGGDDNNAESVMNTASSSSIVAFYRLAGDPAGTWDDGYVCLKGSELYVDGLARNNFENRRDLSVDNRISAHQWVTPSACTDYSYIS